MNPAKWFVILSGEHEGRAHMAGWMETAILTAKHDVKTGGWVGLAICPHCSATVLTDSSYGDRTWAHEQWHAATDHPIPPDVLAKVTR